MEFFGREREIAILRRERELARENSRFTVITGRRRVGKTELIGKALNDGSGDYVTLVLDEFQEMDRINPGFYGEFQGLWDRMNRRIKLNLVVSGSVNRMNEFDLVCENELKGTLDFYEIKRDPKAIELKALSAKADRFFEKNPEKSGLKHRCLGLSLGDM